MGLAATSSRSDSLEPTLNEFTAFHGMVCNPMSAKRCIDYFNGGALFASQTDYEKDDLETFDYTRTPIRLNLFSYYALVVFSCTGLLSLLGHTRAPTIQEENAILKVNETGRDEVAIHSNSLHNIPGAKALIIPRKTLRYISERSNSAPSQEILFMRRFEFEFGSLLSVIMCHLECNGKRFLVEVYAFHHSTNPFARFVSSLMSTAETCLFSLAHWTTKLSRGRATKEA